MSVLFKAEAPEASWDRAKVARFRPAHEREARKERGNFRLPIADCRLKRQAAFQIQSEIGNRKSAMAQEVCYVRR
jgi:hypothetical protein